MSILRRSFVVTPLLTIALLSSCSYHSSDGFMFATDGSTYTNSTYENGSFSMTMVADGTKTTFALEGELTPSLDMQGIAWMEAGSELTIRQTKDDFTRSIQAKPDAGGLPLITYHEQGALVTFEIDDQDWFAARLDDLYGNSSVGAANYAAAVLDEEGVEGIIIRATELEQSERIEACLRVAFESPDITDEQCVELSFAVFEIGYESSRVSMLEELADRHQDNADLTRVLIAGLDDFSSSSHRQDAILALSDRSLSDADLIALLDAARDISYDSNRKETLLALAPLRRLEGAWTRELVDAAGDLSYSSSSQEVIEAFALMDVATDADWALLVNATMDIDYDSNKAEALEALILQMPNSDVPLLAATEAMTSLSYSSSQESVMDALARRKGMSVPVWAAMAEACEEIDYESTRSDALIQILDNAPADIAIHLAVLKSATSISGSSSLGEVMMSLAPYCKGEPGLGVAIAKACDDLSYESNRAEVLVAVANYIPQKQADIDRQLIACAKAAGDIGTSSYQEDVLDKILDQPKLSHSVLKAITRALKDVDYESTRARLQERLIEHLVEQ